MTTTAKTVLLAALIAFPSISFADVTASEVIAAPVKLDCPFLNAYVIPGKVNLLTDVARVQLFMNVYTGTHIWVNGILGQDTVDAIKAFQQAHLNDIMGPWGVKSVTGQVFITTQKMINDIACGRTSATPLSPAEQAIIDAYKVAVANGTFKMTGLTAINDIATTTPPVISISGTSTSPSILNTNASLIGNAFSAFAGFLKSVGHKVASWF